MLATTFADFTAEAVAALAEAPTIEPTSPLVEACERRFSASISAESRSAAVRWQTTIPRGVGLGGSSAIALATLRSLFSLHGKDVSPAELAQLATSVEREDLGIPGGRQDQVVQAHEGLLFMDFARAHYERLDKALLPPLLILLRPEVGQFSGVAHAPLRGSFERGDPDVRAGIDELSNLAWDAREALLEGRRDAFAASVDRTFDLRAQIMPLEPRHVAMVRDARALEMAANFTGSGGAVVCVCRDLGHRAEAAELLRSRDYRVLEPRLSPEVPPS